MVAALRSNGARPMLQRQQQDDRKTTMNKVKQLYLERRYKQCAALCEETLKRNASGLNSLHKTFFHFFTAICYESLGQAAHNYSGNKLPFLNLAQQAFAFAQNTLPLPYMSNENCSHNSPAISPTLTDFASSTSVDAYQNVPPTPTFESPTPAPLFAICARSSTASSSYSEDDAQPRSYSVQNFDDYSPRQLLQNTKSLSLTDEFDNVDGASSPELRLSLKLDTPERQSDLAPKPLFIKKKSIIIEPPIPPCNGLRAIQRQTALQVPPLVNHYESLSTSHGTFLPPTLFHVSATSSLHLARYNADLSSFRTQLSAHVTSVSNAITKATVLQKEHKARQNKQLASYWMLKPAAEGTVQGDRKVAEKKERIERLRQNGWRVDKERFGWKGEEYYRELRRRVEVELRVWE